MSQACMEPSWAPDQSCIPYSLPCMLVTAALCACAAPAHASHAKLRRSCPSFFSQHSPLGMCNDREDAMRESIQRRWGHTCHCALGLGISPAATLVLYTRMSGPQDVAQHFASGPPRSCSDATCRHNQSL